MNTRYFLSTWLALILMMNGAAATGFTNALVPFRPAGFDGNSFLIPLDVGRLTSRFQQVYSSSAFSSVLPPEGAKISEIIFAVDGPMGHFFDTRLPDVQINMSTTLRDPDHLSPVFAENVGTDDSVVLGRGSLHLDGAWSGPNVSSVFSVSLVFPRPFSYNPSAGNLLLDIRNFGGGETAPYDAADIVGDPVSSVMGFGYIGNPLSDMGTATSQGLYTLFVFEPVPEPSTMALLALGLGALALVAGKRIQRKASTAWLCWTHSFWIPTRSTCGSPTARTESQGAAQWTILTMAARRPGSTP